MMKFIKKNISTLFIMAVFAGLFIYLCQLIIPDTCGNVIIEEQVSPDGNFKAVVFQRDCGATTGFSTQISLVKANKELKNDGGNIFIIEGHPDENNIQLQWLSSTLLAIGNIATKNKIYKKEQAFKGIKLLYNQGNSS